MSPRSSEKKSGGNSPAQLDVYVGLLFVAVSALLLGCIFLALELNKYDWQMATQ